MAREIKKILFNNRDGHTVLSAMEIRGLKLTHITNMKELDEVEQMNINRGLIWLETQKGENYLNESFLLKLHKKLFGEVWKWAGAYRKSEKNIGVDAWRIPTEIHKFIADTEYWIKNKTYGNWAELLLTFTIVWFPFILFPMGMDGFQEFIRIISASEIINPIPLGFTGFHQKNGDLFILMP